MIPIIVPATVDLDGTLHRRTLPGNLYAGENRAHRFIIKARQAGAPVALTGSVTAHFIRPDDITEFLDGEIVDGAACVTLERACYDVEGRAQLTIFISDGTTTVAIYAAEGNISRTGTATIVDPGDAVPTIDEYMANYRLAQAFSDELADVRLGLSGTRYGTAGNAVRTELAAVRDALEAAKLDAPVGDGAVGQVPTRTGTGVEWRDPAAPTDAQTAAALAAWLETHPITVPDLGWVTPEMFGAAGDGATDDSAAIQAAVNSGKNVRFISAYRAKNVAISRDIILEGIEGATIRPLAYTSASNQFVNVFTATNADVIIRNIDFVGLGAALLETTEAQSLISVTGGNVRLYGCRFSGFYTLNQAVSGTKLYDRFANILFAVGCVDAVEIIGCTFTDIGGEEIVAVTPGESTPLVGRIAFEANTVRDLQGYSFNLYGAALTIRENYVSGYRNGHATLLSTTIWNGWATHAVCEGNTIVNSDPRDVFDFSEPYAPASGYCGTMLRGYSVRVADNYADIEGGILCCCVGENVCIERNFVRGGALYQGYSSNGPVGANPAAMQPTAQLDGQMVRIAGNVFIYNPSAKSEAIVIRAAIEPYNSNYIQTAAMQGRLQLKRCDICGNVIWVPEALDVVAQTDGGYPAIMLDSMIESVWITDNLIGNPGKTPTALSASNRGVAVYAGGWDGYTIDYVRIAGNRVVCPADDTLGLILLGTYAKVVSPSYSYDLDKPVAQRITRHEYGIDVDSTWAIRDVDIGGNAIDRAFTPCTQGNHLRIYRPGNAFTLTPSAAVSAATTYAGGSGVYNRETNTVRLNFGFMASASIGSSDFFTVPEGYRPRTTKSPLYGAIAATADGALLTYRLSVTAEGVVTSNPLYTTAAKLAGSIEYTLD